MRFEESGLSFHFGAAWRLRKYDEHPFYRHLAGAGLRGVDFIGLHGGQLYLIEVKNYQRRFGEQSPTAALLADPDALAHKVAQKMADSLQALRVVRAYLREKWRFRVYTWLRRHLPKSWTDQDATWAFWEDAAQAAQAQPSHCVLWLETEALPPERAEALRRRIRQAAQARLSGLRPAQALLFCQLGPASPIPDLRVAWA